MDTQPTITLQKATRALAHEYFKAFENDPDLFMDMSLFRRYRYDADRVDAYYKAKLCAPDRASFFILRDSAPIGEVYLKHIDVERKQCELSIHLQNDDVKNKGYGTQAEKLALCYAFEALGMETVLADAVLKNKRSQHVLDKVGFRFVEQNDIFRYYRFDRADYAKRYGNAISSESNNA